MGLPIPLLNYVNCQKIVSDIEGIWLSKTDVDFYFVKPKLIHTTKWKHNFLIFEKNC